MFVLEGMGSQKVRDAVVCDNHKPIGDAHECCKAILGLFIATVPTEFVWGLVGCVTCLLLLWAISVSFPVEKAAASG